MELTEQEVWTDGAAISYVGKTPWALPALSGRSICGAICCCRALKNAHAHSAMTFLRSFADDLPLQSWLFDKVFPWRPG
jgi:5-methylthioadenosine/S-adenosylhomocysteine deaminase